MPTPQRLAVIGVGDVAYRDYLPQMGRIAHLGRVDLAISRNPDRVAKAASDFGIPRTATDWHAALGPDIDVVLNLTPAPIHGEINLALAQAGRSFYSEKPFSHDTAEGLAIAAAAKASGAVVASAPSVMVYPQVKVAAALLAQGVIGKVHSVRATACGGPPPWGGYHSDHRPFFAKGVGPLTDMGVYALHAVTGLLGRATTVNALGSRTREGFAVTEGPYAGTTVPIDEDDNVQLLLGLAGGALCTVQVGFSYHHPASCHVEIAGDDGWMLLALLDPTEPLQVYSTSRGRWTEPVPHVRMDGPDHILGVEHLLECIRDGRPPVISMDHANHVTGIREATAGAIATGQRITLPQSTPQPA